MCATKCASCVWNPWTERNVQMVENIQRQAARFVMRDYRRESSVTSMLNTLCWNTLQQRRLLYQAEMMHKIHHGFVNINVPHHLTTVASSQRLHMHELTTTNQDAVLTATCIVSTHGSSEYGTCYLSILC